MVNKPEQKNIDKMKKFIDKFQDKSGTSSRFNPVITEILVEGSASNG